VKLFLRKYGVLAIRDCDVVMVVKSRGICFENAGSPGTVCGPRRLWLHCRFSMQLYLLTVSS